ncbi:MAG: hypothetical protein JNK57_05425 [Planctomycetaceae bacterium]|nr:hypothetical protein [Planctomycetaceae bacterium]
MLYLLLCYALLSPKTVLNSNLGFPIGQAFVASAFWGFWYAPWILRCYQVRQRLKAIWGWPRFNVVDLLSLSVWIGLIMALARNAWQFHTVRYYEYNGQQTVKFATVLAVFFCVYLWFRATWFLQQCGSDHPLRRMVLLLVVLPAALLCNVDAAMLLVFCLDKLFSGASTQEVWPSVFVVVFLFELILLTTIIHGGMRYVLNDTEHPSECSGSLREPMLESSGSLREPFPNCSGSLREPELDRGAIHDNAPATESKSS